jgi:hypothetical protein
MSASMPRAQRVRRAGPDRRDRRTGEGARVARELQQAARPVGARHAQHVEPSEVGQPRVERLDPDRGRLDDARAQRAQPRRQRAGLCPRARHDHAAPGKRPGREPGELLVQPRDGAHDRDRRRAHLCLARARCDVGERSADHALVGERPALDDRHRFARRAPAVDEPLRDAVEPAHAHVEDERPRERGERRPVDLRLVLAGILVAGDEGDGRGHAALRHRDPGVGRRRDAGGDARHDREVDRRRAQQLGLLAAAPEHERVAALQAHHRPPAGPVLDQQPVDLLLRHLRPAALLADVDELGPHAVEDPRRDQPVMQDHVGGVDQLARPYRQQPRVAGTGTDEVNRHAETARSASRRSSAAPAASRRRASSSADSASSSSHDEPSGRPTKPWTRSRTASTPTGVWHVAASAPTTWRSASSAAWVDA